MVESLGPAAVPEAARVLARAFEVDPAYRHVLPGADREDGLARLFTGMLSVHLPHRCTFVWREAGAVRAAATVRPAGGVPIGAAAMLRHGLLPFGWACGPRAVRRLLWLKGVYDALEAGLASGPHHLVHLVGVAPDRQGAGVGGALVAGALGRACVPGVPAVLTTHLERNVVFYRRLGFEVVFDRPVTPPDAPPWRVWGMRRPAA